MDSQITFDSELGDAIARAISVDFDPSLSTDSHAPFPASWFPAASEITPIRARDRCSSVSCACMNGFSWELVPVRNLNFFRGTLPECVERCITGCGTRPSFNDAFWEAYTKCLTEVTGESLFTDDFTIAIYQHHDASCFKATTRFTLGSVKQFMRYNEEMRSNPILNSFCRCSSTVPPDNIPYDICFTCIQATLDLKALHLVGVLKHFSYEVSFKKAFLTSFKPGVRNPDYFQAAHLFEKGLSNCTRYGEDWLYTWKQNITDWKQAKKVCKNRSFCILCNKAGNGYQLFVCLNCTETSGKMFQKFM